MKKFLLFFTTVLSVFIATSQTKVDSLLQLCDKSNDIQKVDVYLKLSELTLKDSAISRSYNKKAYQLAVDNNLQSNQAQSFYISAKINYTARKFTDAISDYHKALELYRVINDTTGMTRCYRFIGISNFNLSRSKEAIASYLEGLKLAKRDLDYSAELLGNIGLVHNEMNNIDEAISYFRQAISINKSIRDTISLAINYDYLGGTCNRRQMAGASLGSYLVALYLFGTGV
jgi:tetratricopeptide (TPR) repeat protein